MIRAARLLNLRRVRRQPLRALLAVLAVAAGVSLATSILVVTKSMSQSFARFGHSIAGPAPLRVVGATSRGGIDERVVSTVERTPGVGAAVPVVQAVTVAESRPRGGTQVGVLALGVDCRIEAFVGSFGCDPQAVASATDSTPPILAPSLARRLGPAGAIRTDAGALPVAGGPTQARLEAVGSGRVVVFPLPVAQHLFDRPHSLDAIYVRPAPGVSVEVLRARLERAVGGWNGVLRATDPPPGAGLALGAFLPLFGMLAIFAIGIAAVLVYDTVALSIEERRHDLAVVGALGGSSRTIVGGALLESGLLGLVGGVLGGAGAVVLARPITASLSKFTTRFVGVPLSVRVDATPFVIGILLGTVIAVAATWLPARRAMRMDVAAELSMRVLRDEAAAPARIRRAIIFTGAGLVGLLLCWVAQRNGALQQWQPGVGQLGVGVASTAFIVATGAWGPLVLLAAARFIRRRGAAARLGLANLTRDPGRTATMVAAVSAPVATAFIITSFVAAIHDGVTHNVTTGAAGLVRVSSLDPNNTINLESKLSPATLAALARLPGVAHVHRGAYVLSGHDPKTLIGVKASEHPFFTLTVLRGTADPARFARGEALVGPGIARRLQLRPGSKVRLDTPSGWSSVTVQGVWQDGDVNGSVVSMPMPLLESLYGPQSAQEVFLEPSPGSTTGSVARTVRAAGLDPRLQVQTPTELARTISKDINGQFASFWAIQRALLLVAFVAVLSTLLLVAVQRRRELALLAAVGMQPVEMGRMVVLEGVAVGVLGSALVTVFGTGTYFALHEVIPIIIGFRDPFRVAPAAIVLWGVVATVVVAGAAALPAVRTARVEVVENLQYE